MGLVEQIKSASSVKDVETLLQEGTTYTEASKKTQRRWKHVAISRLKEMQAKQETSAVTEKKIKKQKA